MITGKKKQLLKIKLFKVHKKNRNNVVNILVMIVFSNDFLWIIKKTENGRNKNNEVILN